MKRFSFSLEKLLGYRQQVLETERIVLAEMNAALAGMIAERDRMQREEAERAGLLREKTAVGITAVEMESHKNYLTALDFQIRQKKQQIVLQRQAVDRQTERVREAMVEIKAIETLKERRLEEYNFAAQKADEIFIEEIVSSKRIAEKMQG